jgi:hypothetical protein
VTEHDPVRLALSVHEGAHAVGVVLLRGEVCVASIEMPSVSHSRRGLCVSRGFEDPLLSPVEFAWQLPVGARLDLERTVAMLLAGPIAQATYAPLPYDLEVTAPDEQHAAKVLERRYALLERHARELLDLEAQVDLDPARSDEQRAFDLAQWTSGGGGARMLYNWLAHEVALWVRTEEFRRPLAVVARALLAAGELDGPFIHKLVAGVQAEAAAERAAREEAA